jgi:hypothetical protein
MFHPTAATREHKFHENQYFVKTEEVHVKQAEQEGESSTKAEELAAQINTLNTLAPI